MMFNERQKRILQAVTVDYISTAEPVGSRTIARKYNLGVSPATIRNEMYELEEAGYLEQPHTSAGRIPSDLGYRFFVDVLMEPYAVDQRQATSIRSGLMQQVQELTDLLHQTARLLAHLTQYTTILIGPIRVKRVFKSLVFVGVDQYHVLAVLVTEPNFVENVLIELTELTSTEELDALGVTLAEILQGQDLSRLSFTMHQQIKSLVPQKPLYEGLMRLFCANQDPRAENIIIEGATLLLEQPEFMDIAKVKNFLRAMEGKEVLVNILTEDTNARGLRVKIGKENRIGEFQECSLVTATYEYDGEIVGTLGVLGPTRLDYAKATAMVSLLSQILSEQLDEII